MRTLNEQIQRLRDVLVTCYSAIKRKGGTIPDVGERNITNLPAAVRSIPQVHTELVDLEVTANGEYLPADYDADGFSKVTAKFDTSSLQKVKVTSISVNESCFNNGVWEGGKFLDTSELKSINSLFKNMTSLTNVDVSGWDTKNIVDASHAFMGSTNLQFLDVSNWDVINLQGCSYMFAGSAVSKLNLINWDVSNVTNADCMFYLCSNLLSIVGDEYFGEDISCLKNLRISIAFSSSPNLNRASLRALINGLADVNDQPAESRPTLTLGTLLTKLTDEDKAIAIEKGWNLS